MPTITATTHDATFGVVSVTKRTSRPYSHAVIRVSDAGDVSASFHMTREAADKAGGRPAPGVTRHVVPVTSLKTWWVVSLIGDEEAISRPWQADDAAHAEEQHRNAFPEEDFVVANRNTSQKEEIK